MYIVLSVSHRHKSHPNYSRPRFELYEIIVADDQLTNVSG